MKMTTHIGRRQFVAGGGAAALAAMTPTGGLNRTTAAQEATPANKELIYFIPWGDIGFFYNAERRDKAYDNQSHPDRHRRDRLRTPR